jgi:hypothetical protein
MDFIFIAVSRWMRVAIAMNDAAQRRPVCKFVARRSAPIAQRRANASASFGRQPHAHRHDWLTRLPRGKIGLSLASVISAAQANLPLSDQVFD